MYLIIIIIQNIESFSYFLSEHKLVLVGLDNAGKTTILYQLLMSEAIHTSPTIGKSIVISCKFSHRKYISVHYTYINIRAMRGRISKILYGSTRFGCKPIIETNKNNIKTYLELTTELEKALLCPLLQIQQTRIPYKFLKYF